MAQWLPATTPPSRSSLLLQDKQPEKVYYPLIPAICRSAVRLRPTPYPFGPWLSFFCSPTIRSLCCLIRSGVRGQLNCYSVVQVLYRSLTDLIIIIADILSMVLITDFVTNFILRSARSFHMKSQDRPHIPLLGRSVFCSTQPQQRSSSGTVCIPLRLHRHDRSVRSGGCGSYGSPRLHRSAPPGYPGCTLLGAHCGCDHS